MENGGSYPSVVRQHEVFAGDWEIGNAVTVLRHQSPSSNPTPRTLKPQQLLRCGARVCGERARSEADTLAGYSFLLLTTRSTFQGAKEVRSSKSWIARSDSFQERNGEGGEEAPFVVREESEGGR